jgi:hypothetical protein
MKEIDEKDAPIPGFGIAALLSNMGPMISISRDRRLREFIQLQIF